MIGLTDAAKEKIQTLSEKENNPKLSLRVFVHGSGCSGMQYGFAFDSEVNEDDHVLNQNGWNLLVDSMSATYLQGARMHYKEDILGGNFIIENLNADTTCGCGSSFSPKI